MTMVDRSTRIAVVEVVLVLLGTGRGEDPMIIRMAVQPQAGLLPG